MYRISIQTLVHLHDLAIMSGCMSMQFAVMPMQFAVMPMQF